MRSHELVIKSGIVVADPLASGRRLIPKAKAYRVTIIDGNAWGRIPGKLGRAGTQAVTGRVA